MNDDQDAVSTTTVDQVIHASEQTRVVRRRSPGMPSVIIKYAIGTDSIRRLRHERRMLERVASVDGVIKIAQGQGDDTSLVLVDDAGDALKDRLLAGPFADSQALALAISMSRTLVGVHRAGVVHKDINPSNILICGEDFRATLIDFNVASSSAEDRPLFTHQSLIAGTLAYMSPEQTGRTGQSVDQRSDLYALGATLYEVLVGSKPFATGDLLELIHQQLVRTPIVPAVLRPSMPQVLSDIVMRLLEKDPDRRYQSAEGLLCDLLQLQDALERGDSAAMVLGERDFPMRLSPPSRPIGRMSEVTSLAHAVDEAIAGRRVMQLVSGAPGMGKTALINELRPIVTARSGWFVTGKFDQYRQDAPSATVQALTTLGRFLLAETEEVVAEHRARVMRAVGSNAGLGPTQLPEFRLLLGELPAISIADPLEAEARMLQCTLDLLRGIASPQCPVVMVLDDLQWAPLVSLRFIDTLLTAANPIAGLLVVGAYRDSEIDAAHPLSAMLARWQQLGVAPPLLRLTHLPSSDIETLVAAMLRFKSGEAAALAQALNVRTEGNPYDTVELINALRLEGLLAPTANGWSWDAAAIHQFFGTASVVDLLTRRIDKLPAAVCELLEVIACLGGDVSLELLEIASGMSAANMDELITHALEEGLLVGASEPVLRFRHDRVQQAVFERMGDERRGVLHLQLARRISHAPALAEMSAEQYLCAAPRIDDDTERHHAAALFAAVALTKRTSNFAAAERFLGAAIKLLEGLLLKADRQLILTLKIQRHAALYAQGRLDEADELYPVIERDCAAADFVDVAGVQIYSLTNRGRHPEAVQVGLALLGRLGVAKPDDMLSAYSAGLARLGKWRAERDGAADFTRPETTDQLMLARGKLLVKTGTAAYFCDPMTFAWTILEAHRFWASEEPCASMMANVSATPLLLVGTPQDYRGAYLASQHFVKVGTARNFEPGTSFARCVFALSAVHWVEPIENAVAHFHQAREALTQAGDLQFAAYTYLASDVLLDCSATLDAFAAEVAAGPAFAARSKNYDFITRAVPRRQLLRALRGETSQPGSFDDGDFDEDAHAAAVASPSTAASIYHVFRAIGAALFNNAALLEKHTLLAMPLLAKSPGYYVTAMAHVLRALAVACTARTRDGAERGAALGELEVQRLWIAARAADASTNFGHLLALVDAERAWALGDIWVAGAAFDTAVARAVSRNRPWHHALILERSALFHLAQGMDIRGRALLAQARALYERWGASGKVHHLVSEHPFLAVRTSLSGDLAQTSTTLSSEALDMMSVLRASQALSSETSIKNLSARLSIILSGMTGASMVHLLIRKDSSSDWLVAASPKSAGELISAESAAEMGLIPLSAVRYAERTREPLLLDDALRDQRFVADSHRAGMTQCSLLIVPILKQGEVYAMLVLQNSQRRGAFSAERLDAVGLIAGQLLVSLENALLYASLEQKVSDRTAALEEANRQLALLSQSDALTGLANRRHFDTALAAECRRAVRDKTSVGLVMIDIDQFKQFNDHYGHQAGDACLQLVANVMRSSMRAGADLIARYGGEEFVLLLPNTDLKGSYAIAERVRAAVACKLEPHVTAIHGIVTISAGVSSFSPCAGASVTDALAQADAALYEAKHRGRNQVAQTG